MDKLIVQCHYAIPYSLGIPYATMSVPRTAWIYRVPRFPSFAPSLKFAFTDRMNFVERLTTFVFDQLMMIQLQKETTIYVDRLAPDRPSLNNIQLIQRVQFTHIFYNLSRILASNVLLPCFVAMFFFLVLVYSFDTFYDVVLSDAQSIGLSRQT